MELSLLLIIIGIVIAVLIPSLYIIGVLCILIGLVLLIWPRIAAGRRI